MTHLRLWQFEVPAEKESAFVAAYGARGDWARLFETAPGYIRTELWRDGDGIYLTADHWESFEAFERFQASHGEQYRRLDADLEGIALAETFLGAFDLVDQSRSGAPNGKKGRYGRPSSIARATTGWASNRAR